MARDLFTEILEAHTKDLAADWGEPLSPCPSEVALREYHKALAAGLDETNMTLEQRRADAHVCQCKRCYRQIEAILTAAAAGEVTTATASFQGRENDAAFLLSVLGDTARAGWVRAMATDYLGDCGGSQAIESLQYFADNDTDSQVREASREAYESLKHGLARIREWVKGIADTFVVGVPLGPAETQPAFAYASAGRDRSGAREITGTSDDGRLRWQLGINEEIWLRLETEDRDLENHVVAVVIAKPDAPEPAFRGEVTILAVGDARYGASLFLGEAKDIGLIGESTMSITLVS